MEAFTWEAMFALVGSVVVITTGILGYLFKIKKLEPKKEEVSVEFLKFQKFHKRISETNDRIADNEKDVLLLIQQQETLQKLLEDHEERNIRDFDKLNKSLDKITDIVIKILNDEKL